MTLGSIALEKPIVEIFGCGVFNFAVGSLVVKTILGGFFLAAYRIISIKMHVLKISDGRLLLNNLIRLEWLTTFLFLGVGFGGTKMSGTNLSLAFCR